VTTGQEGERRSSFDEELYTVLGFTFYEEKEPIKRRKVRAALDLVSSWWTEEKKG